MDIEPPVSRAALSISDSLRLVCDSGPRTGNASLRDLFASPVLHLIENIYDRFPETARQHLRRHIEVDGALSFAERALVQVSAKRTRLIRSDPTAPVSERITPLPFSPRPEVGTRSPETLGGIRELLREPFLQKDFEAEHARHSRNRPIAAALIHRSGRILLSTRNEGGRIRCRHAEMNLLRLLASEGERIPEGSLLVSGLKPCRMCAAFIASSARVLSDLRVLYLENDPGPLASATALEPRSAGRLEFLREKTGFTPREAQKIVKHPEYAVSVQLSAETLPDTLSVAELFRLFN